LLYEYRTAAGEVTEEPQLRLREVSPLFEQTAIDTYLLTLAGEMGRRFSARTFRAAVPAARCLHVLTTWFPFFAQWKRVNRLSEAELAHYHIGPMAGIRPYLAGVFERFLHAYRRL